jgi:hypothetical protein
MARSTAWPREIRIAPGRIEAFDREIDERLGRCDSHVWHGSSLAVTGVTAGTSVAIRQKNVQTRVNKGSATQCGSSSLR